MVIWVEFKGVLMAFRNAAIANYITLSLLINQGVNY